jgi:hypothetical protein
MGCNEVVVCSLFLSTVNISLQSKDTQNYSAHADSGSTLSGSGHIRAAASAAAEEAASMLDPNAGLSSKLQL